MKKLFTLFLLLTGGVYSANADEPDIYLRSNIYKTTENEYYGWDYDVDDLKFTCLGTNPVNSNEVIYTYTINAATISEDINFRLYIDGWANNQLIPYQGQTTEWDFSSSNSSNYDIDSWSTNFQSNSYADKYFTIKHTIVKASEYKISLYRVTNDGADNKGHIYMVVDVVSMPVTISSYGNATFCSTRALDFTSAGITANIITAASDGILTTSSITKTPANTGLYLEGTAGTVNVPVIAFGEAEDATGNMLVGVTADTDINKIDGSNTNYILTVNTVNGNESTPKFYKVNNAGNTVKANKAYLQIPTASASRDYFWFNDFTTAIEAVKQEQKMEGEVYNLAGQRIAQPTKGLYIVNGKKVIIK